MLKVNNINVFYGDVQILWDISLELTKKELLCVVGSNGAGKTTLLRTISGFLRPVKGSIELDQQRIDILPPHSIANLGIAHIPEGRELFPGLSVTDNLILGAQLNQETRNRINESFSMVYELFPILREREKQLAGSLSGGEQQMLAIGRGLMMAPKLVLFDEPSLGIAPRLVEQIFEVIQRINKEQAITILLIEQNVAYALEISNRAYIFETGRCVQEGVASQLLESDEIRRAYLGKA